MQYCNEIALQSKADHLRMHFCYGDLDLDLVTFIHELDLKILVRSTGIPKMNFLGQCFQMLRDRLDPMHYHPGQLSLAISSSVGAMSTSQRVVTPCSWGVKAALVCVWVAGKTV